MNHIVRLSGMAQGFQVNKDTFKRQSIQKFRDYLTGAEGNSLTSLWARLNSLLHTSTEDFSEIILQSALTELYYSPSYPSLTHPLTASPVSVF